MLKNIKLPVLALILTLALILVYAFVKVRNVFFSTTIQKAILKNSSAPLNIPTYDGSGQITHPDILVFPHPWNGHRYWLVGTPYPDRKTRFENPSIFVSNNAINWAVPEGLSNPISGLPAIGHFSDPDIIYHPSSGIRVYYRWVDNSLSRILVTQSTNGKNWSSPVEIITLPIDKIISPAVIFHQSRYIMYSVKLTDNRSDSMIERRTSRDGLKWSTPKKVTIANANEKIWHLDAQYIPARNEFWMLFLGYPSSSLYLATSKDGRSFSTLRRPLLTKSADGNNWDGYAIYRSTFHVTDKGDFLLWYAGIKHQESHVGFSKSTISRIVSFLK